MRLVPHPNRNDQSCITKVHIDQLERAGKNEERTRAHLLDADLEVDARVCCDPLLEADLPEHRPAHSEQ